MMEILTLIKLIKETFLTKLFNKGKEMSKTIGSLSDFEIIECCKNGQLIRKNFEPENVKQACYELRASNVYYDLSNSEIKYELKKNEYILLKPKQLAVIITEECLNLPADILGRIMTKGKLFSIGILPVNTYADPGFLGELGIVLFNSSNNYLKVKPGEPIAKIEFSRLEKQVKIPYHGQHGYQTKMWLVPKDMILTKEEIKLDNRIENPIIELENSYGKDIAGVIKRIHFYERKILVASSLYLLFIILLIAASQPNSNLISTTVAISLGVVANIITTFFLYLVTNFKVGISWKSKK